MSLIGIFILLFFVNIAIIIYRSSAAQAFEVFSMIKVAALKASGGAFMLLHHHSTHPPSCPSSTTEEGTLNYLYLIIII